MIDWNKLSHLAKMETFEDVQEFNRQVGEVVDTKDPKTILQLMDLFDDECPYHEVMYGLIHAVETCPIDVYVKGVLEKIGSKEISKYSEWLDRLCNRIFNATAYLNIFRTHMHLADRDSLLKLFDLMEKESPHHASLIQELRRELSN